MEKLAGIAPGHIVNGVVTLAGIDDVFAAIIGVVLGLSGIALFLMLVSAGFKMITSGANPKAKEAAQNTATYAIFGMVVVASAYLILRFVGLFTGADVLNFTIFRP